MHGRAPALEQILKYVLGLCIHFPTLPALVIFFYEITDGKPDVCWKRHPTIPQSRSYDLRQINIFCNYYISFKG